MKKKKVKQLEDSAPHDDYHENENRVYVFNNVLFNFNMYISLQLQRSNTPVQWHYPGTLLLL